MNYSRLSFANGIKFYVNTSTPGMHLDDDFAVNQIKSFQCKVCYWQKWQTNDSTTLQLVSTVAPSPVKLYTGAGVITSTEFEWLLVGSADEIGVYLYECTIYFSGIIPNAYYHLYFECTLLSYSAKFVSEKLDVKIFHENTSLFRYKNSFNHLKMFWNTNIECSFRCEALPLDYQPEMEGSDYTDQLADYSIIKAIPIDSFKLYVGKAPGVPDYAIKILNYVFSCDQVRISRDNTEDGLLFTKPVKEKWEATRVKGFPQAGWATTIYPSVNQHALEYNDLTEIAPGIVVGYNINTNLFGEMADPVHIIEIETI